MLCGIRDEPGGRAVVILPNNTVSVTYALHTTGKELAFRSVMLKLAGQNLAEAEPPAWVRFLFYSHPPISERISVADAFASQDQVAN